MLQDCGIQTELNTEITRFNKNLNKTEQAGYIDIRTLNQKDANLVIKFRYKKPACGALRQLLSYLETDQFSHLYQNEKIIILALNFKVMYGKIIEEWIGFLYQDGKIMDAKHDASKCLHAKVFSDLKFKDRPIVEYFKDEN